MDRPEDLPEFENPPLHEAVLGIQYSACPSYNQVESHKLWSLFKDEFPVVEQRPPLEPKFETFGGVSSSNEINVHFGHPPLDSRLWFSSKENNHLIQFQPDRFLLNWKREEENQAYPRFNNIESKFESCIAKLEEYYRETFQFSLEINQAEVTYVNIIPLETYSQISDWLSILDLGSIGIEGLLCKFSEIVKSDGIPVARLSYELQTVASNDGKNQYLRLNLTYRGMPQSNTSSSVFEFMNAGRIAIVKRFTEITSDEAHTKWKRIK